MPIAGGKDREKARVTYWKGFPPILQHNAAVRVVASGISDKLCAQAHAHVLVSIQTLRDAWGRGYRAQCFSLYAWEYFVKWEGIAVGTHKRQVI